MEAFTTELSNVAGTVILFVGYFVVPAVVAGSLSLAGRWLFRKLIDGIR
jgi:hypothetical protein